MSRWATRNVSAFHSDSVGRMRPTLPPVTNTSVTCPDVWSGFRTMPKAAQLIAADVLLTRLQCEAISWAAFGIVRNPDQTSGHVTLVLVTGGKVGRMRPTESE